MSTSIPITSVSASRLTEALREDSEFGATFSDHMLVADWEKGSWKQPQIVPFGPISFSPALTPFHYGQAIFEGFKAHRIPNGSVALFRPRENFVRLNRSASRLAMPEIPEQLFLEGVKELVRLDRDWIPHREGGALYVRPTYFGIDDTLLVRPANRFRLIVMTCPSALISRSPFACSPKNASFAPFPAAPATAKPPATTPVVSSLPVSPRKKAFTTCFGSTASSAATSRNPAS
jgi:branched-chain amino acid aminotransferase